MRFLAGSMVLWAILTSLLLTHTMVIAQDAGGMGGGITQGHGGVVAGEMPVGESQPVGPVDLTAEIRQLRRPHASTGNRVDEIKADESAEHPVRVAVASSPGMDKIERRLSRKNSFEFADAPLATVADWLIAQLDFPIVFDRQALEDEAINPTTHGVTFEAENMSYRSALYHMLREINLTYTIEHEVLLITSKERAEETLETQVYPVWDLARSTRGEDDADFDTLIELITTAIEPNSWDDVGGPGSISAFKGMLTVMNTRTIHSDIAKLLSGLRSFPNLSSNTLPADIGFFDVSESVTKEAAAKVLSESTDFQFEDAPFESVANWIRDQASINLLFDRSALEDEGIDPTSETIMIDVSGVSLRVGLNLMLRDLNLTYVVDHEAIVITSQESAESMLRTKIYSCGAIVDAPNASDLQALRHELDELGETIGSAVSVSTWDDVGGAGSIAPFPARGLLVISQTNEVHGKVEQLLKQLRRGRASQGASPKLRSLDPSEITVRSYALTPDFAKKESQSQLIGFLGRLLRDCDNAVNTPATDYSVDGLTGRLVVAHRRDAQDSIHRLLQKLNAVRAPAPRAGMSTGPGGSLGSGMF